MANAINAINAWVGYAKDYLTRLLMSYIGAYVEGLSRDQLSAGIAGGSLELTNLKLKKSALDKFNVPFEVVEGRIGLFSLKLNWFNFSYTPVVVKIEDVHILIASSSTTDYSREEEEQRAQQLKAERLERAEALRVDHTQKSATWGGFLSSALARMTNNIQISITNVHIRYEDKETVEDHPFSVGITLAKLSAESTNENWQPAFLAGNAQVIHKLTKLDSLSIYFNTDSETLAGLEETSSKDKFGDQISSEAHPVDHQYILKPVSGEGRITLNKIWGKNDVPHYEAQLLFNQLGFNFDVHQYRDIISMADVYHIYDRKHKYRKFKPDESEFSSNKPRAFLKFALTAIEAEVHDRNQRWTWAHFRERRDDRHRYVELFKERELARSNEISEELKALELKLSYHDIRFYRSIARSQLKKDSEAMKILAEKRRKQQGGGWTGWLWGSSSAPSQGDGDGTMTEEERKGLYEILDYDEKAELAESFESSRESISTRLKVQLEQGSFNLKSSPHDGLKDIISLVFDSFEMGAVQRPENFEVALSLGNFRVFDGTTANTLYSQIVHVKDAVLHPNLSEVEPEKQPFFSLKYELKPLDDRADNALTVYLRSMEVIYQRGYVEAVVEFFRPPESQLQSVEALLNVAGEALEGIQKETRAGLEYALETHKTIDLRLDMHAPIIIIPESITQEHCNHLVLDAGRVLVESNLVDKTSLKEIELKRKRKYTDEDYKQLESMMYDNYSVKLIAAQLVVGNSLDACRTALQSETPDPKLHLLERVNIDLLAQNSIVPSARSIARLKMSGRLPSLHVNFSDNKYKTLIRLLDVTIPRLDGDTSNSVVPAAASRISYQPSSGLLGIGEVEYIIDDDDSASVKSVALSESGAETTSHRQHQFEILFGVDSLKATMLKSHEDGSEDVIGELQLEFFALTFAMAKFEMKVDINLRSIIMTSIQPGFDRLALVTTEAGTSVDADLMYVAYRRVQKISPDFDTVYGGFDQSVEVRLSTFIVRAVPEHVLPLYDYIMSTFVPDKSGGEGEVDSPAGITQGPGPAQDSARAQAEDRIRVQANLASFQVLLLDGDTRIATLSLSSANVEVALKAGGMVVSARLGNLLATDDSALHTSLPDFKQLLSIEGSNLAELRYQTFRANEAAEKGINSFVELTTGSLKFHFLESPLNRIYLFLLKFARLKNIYDAAREAAVQRASEIEKMGFKLNVKSPIVVFPIDASALEDRFIMNLGEFTARNEYDGSAQKVVASLAGLQLASIAHLGSQTSRLKIIDDVSIDMDFKQNDKDIDSQTPEMEVAIHISDVKLHVTQTQYCQLLSLARTVPKAIVSPPQEGEEALLGKIPEGNDTVQGTVEKEAADEPRTSLQPELRVSASNGQVRLQLELLVTMKVVKLHLYDSDAFEQAELKDHGISRFALNGGKMSMKMLTDGSLESELAIKSFTMSDTKPGPSKFREIMPATSHGRNQVMILFTMSGGTDSSALAVVTVDSPQIIFSMEPVFALSNYFLSAFRSEETEQTGETTGPGPDPVQTSQTQIHFRFDLYDASVILLENDQDSNTQAIRLTLKQLSLSQQEVVALVVSRLGMSLTRMGKQSEAVRFLDDMDLSTTIESRSELQKQFTGISISIQPIVLRTSYRDITLITSIANKAIALLSNGETDGRVESKQIAFNNASAAAATGTSQKVDNDVSYSPSKRPSGKRQTSMNALLITTAEELNASLEGFRLVLIGDLHEMPMLHLETKSFNISVTDWSGRLHAATTMSTNISYWNLKNSHWEPLIDPWTFSAMVQRDTSTKAIIVDVSSREALDVNLSSSFVELALSTANVWNREGDRVLEKARGSYAPYRIVNRTGGPLFVWSDPDGSKSPNNAGSVKIEQGAIVDWRFDDWKRMREHVSSSGRNSIGIRFDNKPWEQLRSVPVDNEGEFIYSLRPRTSRGSNKLMCEIVIKDNVKTVTLRSTYKIENQTFYPLEVTLVDNTGHPVSSVDKIAPGQDFALPIEAVSQNRIKIRPDGGFGYKWSESIAWEDLRLPQTGTLTTRCPHTDRKEPPFYLTTWPVWSSSNRDYPQLKLILRSPIELENLLPFDIQYKVFDKDSNHNWNSYLRKGGNAPVHSVHLGHLVLLSVTLQDSVYKPSDFTIINAPRKFEFDQEHQLSLADAQDRKLALFLNYVKFPDAGGAFKVQIYSPFVVVNKTGLPFGVRSVRSAGLFKDAAGEARAAELAKSTPFMLSHHNRKGNEFIFRIGDSAWSQAIRFDVPSAESAMVIPSESSRTEAHVGLSWSEGTGKYKLTKVIELAPRFFLYNKLDQPLCFREHGVPPSGRSELLPTERCPLQTLHVSDTRLLTIAYPGLDAQWSSPIDIEAIGSVHVRMRPPGSTSRENVHLIVVDAILDKASIFIVFTPHTGPWPFVIQNDSDFEIIIGQTDEFRDKPESSLIYQLKPRTRLSYAWDFPAAQKKKLYLQCNKKRRAIDMMEIGVLEPLKHATGTLSLDVRADSTTQVLTISNYIEEISLYKPRRRNTTVSKSDTTATTQDFEAVQDEVPTNFSITFDLDGVGVSLMNKQLLEVVYFHIQDLNVEYTNSPVAQSLNLSCGTLQIDNQLHDAFFPVLLQPTPISKEARSLGALPTVQASVIILNDSAHGVLFIKYASILLQAITVQIDEAFLNAVLDLTKVEGLDWETDSESILIPSGDDIPDPSTLKKGQDMYFEVLELQPVFLSVSFVRNITPSDDETQKLTTRNPFAVALNVLTMTLANAEGVELKFNAIGLTDIRLTLPDLQARIFFHYRQEVLRQIYRVLGSADFLGNPVGLFTNVSSGFADIFYEPWHGVVQHGGAELGFGIAKGAASFLKKTVFGVTDSMTKVTSSFGKGLSAATLDADYQAKRRMNQRRNKPRHALVGVSVGAEALVSSLASGVEGVLMKPLEGAEAEGAVGFFKGVGKGIVGVVTKPVVGFMDLAANVTEGIRNTTTVFDNPQRDRVRKPRHIPADGVLQPYSAREALGQYWMRDIQEGKYRKEFYIAHLDVPGSDTVILLTNARILSFSPNGLQLQWDLPLTSVAGVQGESTGIQFTSKGSRDNDRFVPIQDKASKDWFFEKVKAVVLAFNAKRRLER